MTVKHCLMIMKHRLTCMCTCPEVLEHLEVWSTSGLPLSSCSTPSGDHVCFLDDKECGEEMGVANEFMTGTCVIFLPHHVCMVATSNMLVFFSESLIFGIGS